MAGDAVAANVLGTAGAICWSVQLIPQIIINYRRHDTTGLQPTMMLLWACAGCPLGVYNIVSDFNIALQIQPQILTFLSLLTWTQCKYYGSKWTPTKCCLRAIPIGALMGGVESGLVLGLREARSDNVTWPITLMAVLAAVLLSLGVLRHYWDIFQERTVRGISFTFVAIDALGDLTSLMSIFFEPHLDILGMVIYGSELVLWLGVMAAGGYYNLIPWAQQRLQQWMSNQQQRRQATSSPYEITHARSSSSVFQTASANGEPSESLPTAMRLRAVPSQG
ncbi:uncharacterized protein AB675_8096 [Cyphellophora attinorum]|uniref:PQ loop repeat protein n=1 Tax=Cyphellophora attinorum TaxID=1664694 RepID=A0A0N1HRN4_9EURO|nr:uncharacterized protein AB675_8096 [Phialophora attinorum]KPI41000.1 hypothetical protein AB675_8096 [Phialophora attinorum]